MDVRVDSRELAALEARLAVSEAVNRIAASIASCLDLDQLIEAVVRSTKSLLRAEAVTVLLVDGATGELIFDVVEGGAGEKVRSIRLAPGQGIAGWVLRESKAIAVPDVEADKRFCAEVDRRSGYRTRTIVAAPLSFRGKVLGVIEAVNRVDGSAFGPEDARTLEILAPHVAVAIHNARQAGVLQDEKAYLEREVQRRMIQVVHAKKEWERTFDSIGDPLAIIEAGYRIRRANAAVARLAGLSITQVPGRRCYETLFHRDSPCEGCPLEQSLAGEPMEAMLEAGGRHYQLSHFPMDGGEGQTYAVACTYRDVTDRLELERRLRESERMASVGQLAAGVAHEINNPMAFLTSNLSTLRGYFEDLGGIARRVQLLAQVAGSGPDARVAAMARRLAAEIQSEQDIEEILEDALDVLDESETGAARVAHIVRQLKLFALEKQTREETYSLAHSVERAVHALKSEFPDHRVEVVNECRLRVRGCPISMDQAITAVLRNAFQAGPKSPVRVLLREEGPRCTLTVEDDGCGIEEEVLGRVFDPFFTTRDIGAGLGLGLTTAYATVKKHRGTIELAPRPGGGTRVTMVLPGVAPSEHAAARASA
ncbi:MAG: GAF domain-containing protein [Deltaproteobacteria bacterium]|nr:MAG: GAF domain-containing protein [Deltaproteobacteria bacterium]